VAFGTTGSFSFYNSTDCSGNPVLSGSNVNAVTTDGTSVSCFPITGISEASYASLLCVSESDLNDGAYTGTVAFFTSSSCDTGDEIQGTMTDASPPNGQCTNHVDHLSEVQSFKITCNSDGSTTTTSSTAGDYTVGTNGVAAGSSQQVNGWIAVSIALMLLFIQY